MRLGAICLLLVTAGSVVAAGAPAPAQGPSTPPPRRGPVLIGVLSESWGTTPAELGLRDGLRDLGYQEQRDFVVGARFTQGDLAALPVAARELVGSGASLIVAVASHAAKAAQQATDRVPIVFIGGSDPVGLGLVKSLAHPGGNITGVSDLDLELAPKRFEIFKEMIPGLKRVLLPYNAADAQAIAQLDAYRGAARALGLTLLERPVRSQEEAGVVIGQARKGEVDGILSPRFLSLNIPGFMLEASARQGMPTMFHEPFWVERGGLAAYGAAIYQSGKQAARLVDKVIKGARPGDIPVERVTTFELIVNLKTARALGLAIPRGVLLRADRVIE